MPTHLYSAFSPGDAHVVTVALAEVFCCKEALLFLQWEQEGEQSEVYYQCPVCTSQG